MCPGASKGLLVEQLSFFDLQAPQATTADRAPQNFSLLRQGRDTRGLARTWKGRASDNIAAIRLAQCVGAEFRAASPEEGEQLIKFTGFGASELANNLFPTKGQAFRKGWEQLGEALHAVAGREVGALARSTQYAHFTPEFIVSAMWDGVRRLGFAGGRVLEPGCGTGLFLALAPPPVDAASQFVGIERDPFTARIAKLLYPMADIHEADFTSVRTSGLGEFDLAIGNPPFSDRTIRPASGPTPSLNLHEFFVTQSLSVLRPGAVAAFVVSRFLLDKSDGGARAEMAALADLVGAVRLPKASMRESSGTDVVVDVLFFRRRGAANADPPGLSWVGSGSVACEGLATSCTVNEYFAAHPQQVLGSHAIANGPYGPAYTCLPAVGRDLPTALLGAVHAFTGARGYAGPTAPAVPAPQAVAVPAEPAVPAVHVRRAADGGTLREGSYFAAGDVLWQITGGKPVEVPVKAGPGTTGMFSTHAQIIRRLIPVRDAIRVVLTAQVEDRADWASGVTSLRLAYDAFVAKHGPINTTIVTSTTVDRLVEVTDEETGAVIEERVEPRERTISRRPNLTPFLDDPDVWLVASIEAYDPDTNTAKPGPIFTQRVIRPPVSPVITCATDALAVTLAERGKVDILRTAELFGETASDTINALGTAIYEDPETGAWVTADAYLSGPVRTKLSQAERARDADSLRFGRNVAALEAVQPVDLKPSEITARLGAPWVPVAIVERFILEAMRIRTRVYHTPGLASWTVDQAGFRGNAAGTSEWGTQRRHAGDLLEDALNSSIPRIYDTEHDEFGKKRQVFNAPATEAAKEKLEKIKRAFEAWVWKDATRADELVRIYNDGYNNLVPRHFDGSHLHLAGASNIIDLRPHQKRGIWRIICAGSTYLAHAVGAGKTFLMAAALMEQKRLGLVTKPMMVVPGHCLAQAAREFLMLYPTARILVADEQNFARDKRQRFIARAATGDWDCIIITHSAFKFIPAPGEFERSLIEGQIAAFEELLLMVEDDDRVSRKRLERLKEGFAEKLARLSSRKDDLVTIAEMGVDQLVIDEAQEFRKLSFATNMSSLRGIDADGSQRAWDLYVKVKFLDQAGNGRSLIMASGTPVTNTMGELFTLLRFMAEAGLTERDVHQFDAWASTFGETRTDLELQPSGLYKPATRFSQFVNVPELIAMFRTVADVVLKNDLRAFMKLPRIKGGKRQIVTAKPSPAFRDYQRELARRIAVIEARKRPPRKGDDIILSVIGDGRHAALDMRFVGYPDNEPDNKLNALVKNAFLIWQETGGNRYTNPATGEAYPLPGAAQMIFSDLGTLSAEATRGFSAYAWIRSELVRLGVPAEQIAIMQHYKKSAAKLALFADLNSGQKRFVIGSSETMGTGVNAQQRLIAEHHADVPWLPSWIEQREGRIDRQGNQNEEIGIYAYATTGSMDATMWQTNERKARFIAMALSGDRSIRKLDDVGDTVDQFAFAKALASGDSRLMQKAGLEAELARLRRLEAAHFDDQHGVRRRLDWATKSVARGTTRIPLFEADVARFVDTHGDLFEMTVEGKVYKERKVAGAAFLAVARKLHADRSEGEFPVAHIAGFPVRIEASVVGQRKSRATERDWVCSIWVIFNHGPKELDADITTLEPLGLTARLENVVRTLDYELMRERERLRDAERDLAEFGGQLQECFEYQAELDAKTDELLTLNESLARNTMASAAA